MIESKTVYFENPGKENTDETLRIARRRAEELGIKTVLAASTTGETAVKTMSVFKGFRVIIVAHSTGFKEANAQEFTENNLKMVQGQGGTVLFTTHALGGLNRAMRQGAIPEATTTYIIGDIVASALRVFGEGMKVACEIAAMAADGGLVRTDEEVISIAGTGSGKGGRGADTAIVVQPANVHLFFRLQVKEIICKPRNPHRY